MGTGSLGFIGSKYPNVGHIYKLTSGANVGSICIRGSLGTVEATREDRSFDRYAPDNPQQRLLRSPSFLLIPLH